MAIECTYCEEKVNAKQGIYIRCTTCQDIKLCLECFSAGATIAEHESNHPYELIDCGSFPIIDESWKAYEELALLEAIELFGIGSWTDIANAVETRSAEECCERYTRIYVENFFGRSAWNSIDRTLYNVQDHTCSHNQPLSPSLSLPEKHKIVDIDREQQIRLGYMPKRDDFEREFDNDAELLVSKLAVNANDDTELDQNLKIAHINMYTDKLRERFRRKRIVLEYNLVKLFFHMHPEENSPQDTQTQSIITNTAVPITATATTTHAMPPTSNCKLSTSESQSSFKSQAAATLKTNHQPVQNTILNYFRRVEPTNGTATKATSSGGPPESSILSSYFSDLNKTIAEQDFNTMEKKLRIFCQFSSAEEHNRLIRNLAREKELKVKIKDLIKKRKNGFKFHNNFTSNSINGNDNSKQSPLVFWNSEPSWRLLSESEKLLCKSSNLMPSQYISFKAVIIKEHIQKKKRKGAVNRLFSEGTVKRRIAEHLYKSLE